MTLQPNTTLQQGRYRIIEVLGQGGFGITYLAEQVMAERKVCIKEFFPKDFYNRDNSTNGVSLGTQGSAEYMERFKEKFIKEAKTIAKFDHPNIIHIFDVFEENNTCYYVMEYIEGESLHDHVQRTGPMDEQSALRYIREAGAAIAHIHQNSVNHLDIKPSNIMVRHSDDRAILIDFGVSKHYDKDGSQTSTTPVGLSHGFAPMEQYREGGVSSFSPETDIYSLGATLYSILTATIPPMASDVAEDGLPKLPEHINATTCRAIERAMEMRRKDRPHSIEEFFTLLDGSAIPTQSKSPKVAPIPVSEETVIGQPQIDTPKVAPAPAPASEETVIGTPTAGATTPSPAPATPKKEWTPKYAVDNKGGKKSSEPKKKSKIGIIIAIIVGLLLIGCGLYFVIDANNSNNASDGSDSYYSEPASYYTMECAADAIEADAAGECYGYDAPAAEEYYEEVCEAPAAEEYYEEVCEAPAEVAVASDVFMSDDGYVYDDGAYLDGEIYYNDNGGYSYYLDDGRFVYVDNYGYKSYYRFDEYNNMYDENWNFIMGPDGESYPVYE